MIENSWVCFKAFSQSMAGGAVKNNIKPVRIDSYHWTAIQPPEYKAGVQTTMLQHSVCLSS